MTLSTCRPRSAARRCSAVEHSGPDASPKNGGEFGGGHGAHICANFALDRAFGGYAAEDDALVVAGRIPK